MVLEGPLPSSQEPTSSPCPETGESSYTTSQLISLRSSLILSSYLHLGLPRGLFSSGFPSKILYAFFISPMRAASPAPLILLDLVTWIMFGEPIKLRSSSLCSFLHPPSFPPSYVLITLFSYTFNWFSSLSLWDQVSHPYNATGEMIVIH